MNNYNKSGHSSFADNSFRRTRVLNLAVLFMIMFSPINAFPETDIDKMQDEIVNLRQRVELLESQLNEVLKLVNNDTKSPARETTTNETVVLNLKEKQKPKTLQIGGRVKVDAIYNSRAIGQSSNSNQRDLVFSAGNIPVDGIGEKGQFNFNARETRLWLTANVPTELGTMGGHVEMDFFSTDKSGNEVVSNSYIPRLRHAYVNYADFTAGQTWTTFMNVSALPDMNDSGGPSGVLFVRQPLLRYQNQQDWGKLSLALEQPESTLTSSNGTRIATDDERIPDIISRIDFDGTWGNLSIAGLLRQIRNDMNGNSDSSWGAAVNASGRIYTRGADNIRFALSYGNALGRYMSVNSFADGNIDGNGKIHLNEMFGAHIAYQHWWSDKLRSNLSVGYSRTDNNFLPMMTSPVELNKSLFSSHLNLLWSPTTSATLGIEWIHGNRNLEDGRDGKLDRIQFSSMFRF
jgi:hypothetical protein